MVHTLFDMEDFGRQWDGPLHWAEQRAYWQHERPTGWSTVCDTRTAAYLYGVYYVGMCVEAWKP